MNNSHPNRRLFLQSLLNTVSFFSFNSFAYENGTETANDCSMIIEQSLERLSQRQNKNGSFGTATELFGTDPAVASLVGLAFLASGHLPGRGKYGKCLDRIVDFLLECSLQLNENQDSFNNIEKTLEVVINQYVIESNLTYKDIDGLIADLRIKGQKPLYGHGYAVLFLAEVLGVTSNNKTRHALQSAIKLIINTQNLEGGWRYMPEKSSVADISVTACQVAALRACQNAGLFVPQYTIDQALNYIATLQNKDGGFRYMSVDGPSGYGRTAAAIHVLQICDYNNKQTIQKGIDYLESFYLKDNPVHSLDQIEYWTYSQFYASLAMYRNARERHNHNWSFFSNRLYSDLLKRRSPDGLWYSKASTDAETAFAICIISTSREQIPFFLF